MRALKQGQDMDDINFEEVDGLGNEAPNIEMGDRLPPFAMVPFCIILDRTLGNAEKIVYAYMVARCGQKKAAWVSQRTMGDDLGISRARINELMATLEKRGLLRVSRTNQKDGKTNTYYLPKAEAIYGDGAYWGWNDYWKGGVRRDVLEGVSRISDRGVSDKLDTGVSAGLTPQVDKEQGDKVQIHMPSSAPAPVHDGVSSDLQPAAKENENKGLRNTAVMGVFGGSKSEPLSRKDQRKANSEEKIKNNASILHQKPENVSQIEWDLTKGPPQVHKAFRQFTELGFGMSYVPPMTPKERGQWKWLIQKTGSAAMSIKFVEFVVDNWPGLCEKYEKLDGRPSVGLFCSGWFVPLFAAFEENGKEAGRVTLSENKHQSAQDILEIGRAHV